MKDEFSEDEFSYTGNFSVVAGADGAVLVKKEYAKRCPICADSLANPQNYIRIHKLEMVPHDNIPFGEV